jgi:hypothetical protein
VDTAEANLEVSHGAHRCHLALHMGLATVADVIQWADALIAVVPQPSAALLDVSLAPADVLPQDMGRMLEALMEHPRQIAPLRRVLGEVATRLRLGTFDLRVAIENLTGYGFEDRADNRWLPPDMAEWLRNIFYEALNVNSVYPTPELRRQGMQEMVDDFVAGLESLGASGTYHYALRPAVRRSKERIDVAM